MSVQRDTLHALRLRSYPGSPVLGTRARAALGGRGAFIQSEAVSTEASNRETLVCVQIEDTAGLANLREILTVPGIDVFFVGPSDLAQAMGHPGRADTPEVRRAIEGAFEAIRGAGKAAGSTGAPDAIPGLLNRGVLYTYTHLTRLLAAAAGDFLRAARAAAPR